MIDAVASALAVKTSNLLCAVAYTDAAADSDLTRRRNVQLIHPELVTKYGLETAAPKLAKIAASHAYRSLLAAPTADAPPAAAAGERAATVIELLDSDCEDFIDLRDSDSEGE